MLSGYVYKCKNIAIARLTSETTQHQSLTDERLNLFARVRNEIALMADSIYEKSSVFLDFITYYKSF